MSALLLFLDSANALAGWLRLDEGMLVARGSGSDAPAPPGPDEELDIVAVVPGESVSVHWLEIPAGLAPAQAAAAARLIAADVSAQPLEDMHVAVGPDAEVDARAVALTPALTMAEWLASLQARGFDPDLVIPAPLLLPEPDEGLLSYPFGEAHLYRGKSDAFSIEPELAAVIVGDTPVSTLDDEAFQAGLGTAIASPAVNLRQGPFAKARRWALDWRLMRRLATLALALLAMTLIVQIASILRYTYAADALQAEAEAVAAQALPASARTGSALDRLGPRMVELRGGGIGFGATASAVFGAVRDTPNVQLIAATYERDGSLRATAQGDSPASLAALRQRIEAAGFGVSAGEPQAGASGSIVEITVRPL